MCVCAQSCLTLCKPMDYSPLPPAPLSRGFSRQEYWSKLPFPTSGAIPDPGIKPESLVSPALAGGFFTTVPPGKMELPNQSPWSHPILTFQDS